MIDGAHEDLCAAAGVDPNEQITRFVMADFASTLLQMDYTQDQRVAILKAADAYSLAGSLTEASGWVSIFETCAQLLAADLGIEH